MSVLLIAEHNNKQLKPFTLNAVTAASQIDADVHAVVIGQNCGDASKMLSELPLVKALGVSRDNNFWVFDQDQQALKKLSGKLELISNSGNLINITSKS